MKALEVDSFQLSSFLCETGATMFIVRGAADFKRQMGKRFLSVKSLKWGLKSPYSHELQEEQ